MGINLKQASAASTVRRTLYGVAIAGLVVGAPLAVLAKETPAPGKPSALQLQAFATTNATLILRGPDARQQLLVTASFADGRPRDYTHRVTYKVMPPRVARVDADGVVTPLGNGEATITAKTPDGVTGTVSVKVENFGESTLIHFANQIVPIFTKTGCNGGGCHGKSSGQNGFRLSLLGFEPTEDYEHLVREARGRRVFTGSPENSLLLLKGIAELPHGGGKRLEKGSPDYDLLVRWIGQGMPQGDPKAPTVARIEVHPKERVMDRSGEQQLVVLAHYTDGKIEDVTASALYEANDKNLAKTDEKGRVSVFDQPGDVAVMVRYQAKVATFTATVPLGAPVENLPTPRNYIDELVFKKLKAVGMPPSPASDDSTFIRRVTLDIAGRLPTPEETQRFLTDKDPTKRDKVIDSLLSSPDYAEYFANKWSALLRNKRSDPKQTHGTYAFHGWIRDSLHANKPYDQFAREIMAASGEMSEHPPVAWYRQVRETTVQLEDTAQLFLGTRLQCAQCHHHPYERWSQQDYYSFAAFFSRVGRKRGDQPGEEVIFHQRGGAAATNKKNGQQVKPAGLGAPAPELSPDDDPRHALVDWMSGSDNPFFAKSLVNRYWKHLFGRGLVEPEDDMRETNPATNPELLEALARDFAHSGYDMKKLVRTIAQSQVYQLSSEPNKYNAIDKQYFSRYYPKRLTAEVLLDSVNELVGATSNFEGQQVGTRAVALPDNSYNAGSWFLTVFGRPDSSSSCECERSQDASLSQSLHLLNSKEIQDKLMADAGRAAKLAADDKRGDEEKLRELYVRVLSREPKPEELSTAQSHLNKKRTDKDGKEVPPNKRQAYEDIIWALMNTKEFLFNH